MPLKIVLKNGEKIIINGAVLQNIGGAAKALVLNEAAVHALPVAVAGVCGPAKRSRRTTCVTPKRSTTATAT